MQKMLQKIVKMANLFTLNQAIAGVSPSGKAAGFGPAMRRFESFHPN